MFKITVYCEDKRLAEVLHSLAGRVRGQPEVLPVTNVVGSSGSGNGKVKAAGNGNLTSMFTDYLQKTKPERIVAKVAQDWLEENGKSRTSASYLLKQCVNAGVLRKHGKSSRMTYTLKGN